MGFKLNHLALLCGAFTSIPVMASATTQAVDEQLVVIGRQDDTPLNIAANVVVIDAADIQQSGASNLSELLRGRSGIQISDNNSGPVLAMRGFSSSQAVNNTLILIDGRRLNNIDIAAPSLSAIAVNQIERVEILSGSAGVLYGDQAVGGVINIITKAPSASGGNLTLSGGSFDTYEGRGDLSGAINDNWRYYLAAAYNESDNYRRNNANETGSVLGRLQYDSELTNFFVEGSYYDNKRQTPGSLTLAQFEADPRQATSTPGDYNHEMTSAWRAHLQRQVHANWALAADLNYSDTLVSSVSYGSPGRNERSLLEFNPKALGRYQTRNGELSIVIGADIQRGETEFDLSYMQRSNTQTMTSTYLQANVPLTNSLSYVVGGRYAKVKDELKDGQIYPNGIDLDEDAHALELGLNYRPLEGHRFYLRGDESFRFAKVDEQAYTPPTVVGLKPQTGRSIEAGWDWTLSNQSLRLNLYRLSLEDEIVFDPSADMPIGGAFPGANVNADASRRYGASLDWDWQLNEMLQLGLEYNYIDAEFTEGANKGKSLSWVAEHSGRIYTSVDFGQHWQLFVEGQYLGDRYMEGDNGNQHDKLDSYWLGNIALNYSRDAWLASLRVDNLFDKQYASSGYFSTWGDGYYSGSGRALRFSVSYRF
ncbi:TonB-dependent receptor [Shewanella algae]|uniref:TonB-dependent receptor n=1 Tax=Shewanella algae TaxID=38313 RepID=UPI001AAEF241|nr:TonB-dependent receptor [Shewanella algae]MBO2680525.1 TonB-dependent receptor [Shewanella algae]